MKKSNTFSKMWFLLMLLVTFVAGCGGGDGAAPNSAKATTAYSLAGSTGTVDESAKTITVSMPYGTDVKAQVATFTTTGSIVTVGTVEQKSGTTPNNFTSPVKYTVTATDKTTATYTVTVFVAQVTDKAISAYSLAGIPGTVDESAKTIAVTVPYGTDVKALVATFAASGTTVNVGTAAQKSGATPNDFTNPVTYTVIDGNGNKVTYTVTVNVGQISSKAVTAYSLDGVKGTIDEAAKKIAVTVPNGKNVTALVATFSTNGTSVKVGTALQKSGTTPNNFTAPVAYIVSASDNTTATYTVTVTVAPITPKAITAFSVAGFAGTVNENLKTIAVTVPNGTLLTNRIATFTTTGAGVKVGTDVQTSGTTTNTFTGPVTYRVTATDNTFADYVVTVKVAMANPTAPNLGEAGRFVILASQAVTTIGTTAVSNGDIGIIDIKRIGITGFTASGPAGDYAELTNGTSYGFDDANPAPFPYPLHYSTIVVGAPWTTTGAMITQVRTDLGIANTFLAADPNPSAPTQVCPIELGGLILNRGVYKTASNVGITTGPLHFDAQGDPNAVFIISTDGTFTTGASGSIILDNGAQAKNIFIRSAGITTIAAGTTFYGNVFAGTQVNVLSGARITGRLFAVTDRVTLIADAVTKAP